MLNNIDSNVFDSNSESNRNPELNDDTKSLFPEQFNTQNFSYISILEDNEFPINYNNLNHEVKERTNATSEVGLKNEINIVKKDSTFIKNQKEKKTSIELSGKKRGRLPNNEKYDENGNIIKSGKHNEYTDDNIHKKVRTEIKNIFISFVNKNINKKIDKNTSYNKIQLKQIKQKTIININAEYNKKFKDKTMGEILSEEISKPNWNHPKDYNKEKIQELRKDEYFEKLFSISFGDCLKYFRGDIIERQEYIKGMKTFFDVRYKYEKDDNPEYAEKVLKFLKEYENYLNNQHSRERKK